MNGNAQDMTVVSDKGLPKPLSLRVPNFNGAIAATANQEVSLGAEAKAVYLIGVPALGQIFKHMYAGSRIDIPEANSGVTARRCKQPSGGMKIDRADLIAVAAERSQMMPRRRIPKANGMVSRAYG
jgi:hypothetical protein